jgi:hypothetical protein
MGLYAGGPAESSSGGRVTRAPGRAMCLWRQALLPLCFFSVYSLLWVLASTVSVSLASALSLSFLSLASVRARFSLFPTCLINVVTMSLQGGPAATLNRKLEWTGVSR